MNKIDPIPPLRIKLIFLYSTPPLPLFLLCFSSSSSGEYIQQGENDRYRLVEKDSEMTVGRERTGQVKEMGKG